MGEKLNWRTNMKRLYIVVEGPSEQEFVNTVLRPYFNLYGIYNVTPILIRTSKSGKGGFVNYLHLKNTIKPLLASQKGDFIVSTFVDFFRIPNNIPNYEECMRACGSNNKVLLLEQNIGNDIGDRRFIPYIQLHEFEALLFANNNGFKAYFTDDQALATDAIVNAFDNPEEINTHPEYAPSKRILSIKNDYNKPIEGNLIALEIGITTILERCPRFASWVNNLIEKCSS